MKPVELVIIGAGGRGTTYAEYARAFPDRARVVAVAEPRDAYRERMASGHGIPVANVFRDWREVIARPRLADAVVISTQDRMHAEPAIAFADLGYDILLEKPMAPQVDDCRRIVDAIKRNHVLFAVCHVLRYTRDTQRLKSLIDSGAIGDVVSLQRLEPVGFWHQAHSFVRGNWRNEAESGFMLLTKSCHDLDWIRYIMGVPCQAVSSFGTRAHFRRSQKPTGSGVRCLECALEPECPYSAVRLYLGALGRGHTGWPLDVLTTELTPDGVLQALREGPYGRCVYVCDNDVVDNQIVNMQFEGDRTASFTMMAFTKGGPRETRVFGTRGELLNVGSCIEHYDFLTDHTERIEVSEDSDLMGGHGGGDYWLMNAFVQAVAEQNPRHILSGPDESLESHLMVFAAEEARRQNCVVRL